MGAELWVLGLKALRLGFLELRVLLLWRCVAWAFKSQLRVLVCGLGAEAWGLCFGAWGLNSTYHVQGVGASVLGCAALELRSAVQKLCRDVGLRLLKGVGLNQLYLSGKLQTVWSLNFSTPRPST